MSSGLVIIGKSASGVGMFYEAKIFFPLMPLLQGGMKTQSIIDFAPICNLSNDPQTALGHLPCLKTWRPISPWMDANHKHLLELPRAVVPSETPVRFGSLLLCNENHAPLHHGDGCSF